MYYLDNFYVNKGSLVTVSPEQANKFAKEIANDFNPLHDPENKRFCVPGDLLFAITLAKYGLSQNMLINYKAMVGKGIELVYPAEVDDNFVLLDSKNKEYVTVQASGNKVTNLTTVEAFTKAYVSFSGHCFPHILVPLMKQKDVMINLARPMVIYESMAFKFDKFDLISPSLSFTHSSLEVNGKRGLVKIYFDLLDQGVTVGTGYKNMILSGLREYEEDKMQELVDVYNSLKNNYVTV